MLKTRITTSLPVSLGSLYTGRGLHWKRERSSQTFLNGTELVFTCGDENNEVLNIGKKN
jgi:hypothetical protein